jgi:molecular chaperone DnaJ
MKTKTDYLVLGVSPNESSGGIRQAFRELVKRYHPDRIGPHGLRVFQEIVEAYHVLADPERRRHYDRGLLHAEPRMRMPDLPISLYPDQPSPSLVPQVTFPIRCIPQGHAAFEAAFARVVRSFTAPSAPREETWEGIDIQAIVSPDEAEKGGATFLTVPSCEPCRDCGGSGRAGLSVCEACDGAGLLAREETVRVFVPPRVGDATLLELPLRGLGVHHFYLRLHLRVLPKRGELSA